MKASRALIFLAFFVILIGGSVIGFNFVTDPQCYYNCSIIDVNRQTTNSYYRIAQEIKKHPEAEVIVVGSSRGGTTSPQWVSEVTGKKALNLSAAGAAIFARAAFLEMALQETQIKKVLWYADYFEILGGLGDEKITRSPALYRYIDPQATTRFRLIDLQVLIDRNTLEASFHALRPGAKLPIQDGSDIDYKSCTQGDYPGGVSPLRLDREVELLYESYTRRVFAAPETTEAWSLFEKTIRHLDSKGVQTVLVISPYHPIFRERLKIEYPAIWQRHLAWTLKIQSLQLANVKVVNYLEGFPGETATVRHWDDGVHFNCHSAIQMTENLLRF